MKSMLTLILWWTASLTATAQVLGVAENAVLIDGQPVEIDAATLRKLQDEFIRRHNESRTVVGVGRACRPANPSPMEKSKLVSEPAPAPEMCPRAEESLRFTDRYVPFMIHPNTPALSMPWAGSTQYIGNNIHIYPQDPTNGLVRSLTATAFGPWIPGIGGAYLTPFLR